MSRQMCGGATVGWRPPHVSLVVVVGVLIVVIVAVMVVVVIVVGGGALGLGGRHAVGRCRRIGHGCGRGRRRSRLLGGGCSGIGFGTRRGHLGA